MDMEQESKKVTNTSESGLTYLGNIGASKILGAPVGYKLKQKTTGELVLMQARQWSQGSMGGIEWSELETEIEDVKL